MNNDNRVLGRRGARELTPRETEHVTGGIQTNTLCTFDPESRSKDGDSQIGEC
jgi:hypothetical protein